MSLLSSKTLVWTWRHGLLSKTSCISLFLQSLPSLAWYPWIQQRKNKRPDIFNRNIKVRSFLSLLRQRQGLKSRLTLHPGLWGALTRGSPYKGHHSAGPNPQPLTSIHGLWAPSLLDYQLLREFSWWLLQIACFKQPFALGWFPRLPGSGHFDQMHIGRTKSTTYFPWGLNC